MCPHVCVSVATIQMKIDKLSNTPASSLLPVHRHYYPLPPQVSMVLIYVAVSFAWSLTSSVQSTYSIYSLFAYFHSAPCLWHPFMLLLVFSYSFYC